MKLPIDWLREFVEVNESADQVADRLYNLGFGVESVENDVIDLEVTPNRGDALSILGLAREYAASTGQGIIFPQIKKTKPLSIESDEFDLKIETKEITAHKSVLINNIKVISSPEWLVKRLESVGIGSINSIVDITNYVMVEYGIPLHAFDVDTLRGSSMRFRESENGETITTLNKKTYKLKAGMIVAEDNERIIDLVAIQGGLTSGVTNSTKNILLHAVIVNPKNIRRTSKTLNLSTDASYRYERGVDSQIIDLALSQALNLTKKISGGQVRSIFEAKPDFQPKEILFDWDMVNTITGTNVNVETSRNILIRLGFHIEGNKITVPSWRKKDITYPEDIVEEIARVYGYNNLKTESLPPGKSVQLPTNKEWRKQRAIADKLRSYGFNELMTYSFVSKNENTNLVEVANPISPEYSYLRSSLIPKLIETAEHNMWSKEIKLFEIGNVFSKNSEHTKISLISNKKIDFIDGVSLYANNTRRKYFTWEGEIETLEKSIPESRPKYYFSRRDYQPVSKFPPTTFDVAIAVNQGLSPQEIRDEIFNVDDRIKLVELFDEFENDKLGNNKKSMAFHIIIDDPNKTLETAQTLSILKKITEKIKAKFDALIR